MNSGNALQRTVKREGSISGIGLHTGKKSTVRVKPAPVNAGLRFFRNGVKIDSAVVENVRCTAVGRNEARILTVEHFFAALFGAGIANLDVDVDGPEMPGLDGSAKEFMDLFEELGIVDQPAEREAYKIKEPIFCHGAKSALAVYPASEFSVAYTMDYDHPFLSNQKVDFTFGPGVFRDQIAPARTFCTEKEAAELKDLGFGVGADHGNTLVISENGPVNNKLRFSDECARHKVLDILGDLGLLGFAVIGRVVGLRSGHVLNQKLAEDIKKQRGQA